MQLARVIGTVVATLKDPGLASRRLLVIQPIAASGGALGTPLVAVDGVGVGAGEEVMFVKGREAAFAFLPELVVADASIVGKVDAVATKETAAEPRPASAREERPRRRAGRALQK
jgi:ethanolamine utilization protein EutN